MTDRIAIAQQHADIATDVVNKLVARQYLTRAQHGRAYHRCRALLAAHPDWTADDLHAHCVDAFEERDREAQRLVDANIQRCVDKANRAAFGGSRGI